ncbi:hypothetical protein [Rubellicoccus peritrichatus]|uniref:Response regulatory domain-containing protein n=1 Tax=Rubellicoccus peritrichatus TaxID=3080537 RepID=A0AAQ3QU18_9BACT|nr:hypothetical protein [Puniceicoccus sp. CR14]WOO39525.1 hypothetical protein RZN69_12950 [Puniceicoccus sp. CR14]
MTQTKTVLLVIQDARDRSKLSLLLREMGVNVISCPDPDEATTHLGGDEMNFAAAVVESNIPGYDGSTLVRELAKVNKTCNLVLLTEEERIKDARLDVLKVQQIVRTLSPREMMKILQIVINKPATRKKPKSRPQIPIKPETKTEGSTTFYNPSFVTAKAPPSKALIEKLWYSRNFNDLVILTGEAGSEFELVVREMNTLSGTGNTFPIHVSRNDLIKSDYLESLNAQTYLRASTPPILYIHEIDDLEPPYQKSLQDFIHSIKQSSKRHVRLVMSSIETADHQSKEAKHWLKQLISEADAHFRIPPLRDRKADLEPIIRKTFSDLTTLHPFVNARSIDDSAMDYMCKWIWKGNYSELVNVLRTAIAICPVRSIELGHIQPLMGESSSSTDLMENAADEKLLYPDFAV